MLILQFVDLLTKLTNANRKTVLDVQAQSLMIMRDAHLARDASCTFHL